jgi:hypothetical protein
MSFKNDRFDHLTPRQRAIEAFYTYGSCRAAARALGMAKSTIAEHLKKAGIDPTEEGQKIEKIDGKPLVQGSIAFDEPEKRSLPPKGQVYRYILTSAQNNTTVHHEFIRNLEAYAKFLEAEIHVARFQYNIQAYRKWQGSEKPDAIDNNATDDVTWFDPNIRDYISDDPIELAPGLIWCGEQQILPTVRNPASGFQDYRGCNSLILPSTKIALTSIPTGKFDPTKFLYTTGCITQRNYTKTKTGYNGSWNHVYGAVIVEVDSDGDWFVRQISARDEDGSFQDLNYKVRNNKVETAGEIDVLTPGDIHVDQLEDKYRLSLAEMVDTLRPNELHLHDCLDFNSRSHHDAKDHHKNFEKFINGCDNVEDELRDVAEFFQEMHRDWMQMVVIHSNHDDHLRRWLKDKPDAYAYDPPNALIFLTLQKRIYEAKFKKEANFHLFEYAMELMGIPEGMRFLRTDENYLVHGIECGLHGDNGPNGSRGSISNLAKSGNKVNIGHSHSAGIMHGAYQSGVMANLDMDYNTGPSSWSRSLIVTYENGKRAIITMRDTKWRAKP